jgi:hypothetical protein
MRSSNYDKFPFVPVTAEANACQIGWAAITSALQSALLATPAALGQPQVLAVECYPGTDLGQLQRELTQALRPAQCLVADDLYRAPGDIDALVAGPLTDDPVFGRLNGLTINDFFNPQQLRTAQANVAAAAGQLVLVLGTGATLVCPVPTVLVYADLARWEIQLRQRCGEIANLGSENFTEKASL